MRLREHEGIKEGKLDMLRADPRHLIVQDGYNVRDLTTPDAIEKLKELSASIAENGVMNPLVVRFDAEGEKIIVIEGHRRLAATMMAIEAGAEIKSVPIYQSRINDADRDLGLIISNSGEPLTQLEKAKVVGRLVAHGWSYEEIRKRCGWKSVNTVTDHLKILALPAEVQQDVKNGVVSATVARQTVEEHGEDFAAKLIRENAEENQRIRGKARATPRGIKAAAQKAKPKPDKIGIPPRAPRGQTPITPTESAGTAEPGSSVAPERVDSPTSAPPAPDEPVAQDIVNRGIPEPARQAVVDLIEALAPFAGLANEHDLSEREDSDVLEVMVRDVKRAAIVYARSMGGEG